jgi:phosphoribosylanthranilate isomerase
MTLLVKICGLSTPETLNAALEAGADMVGFNFHPKSPRYVTPQRAAALRRGVNRCTAVVAVTVDLGDEQLGEIVRELAPDWLQLHGAESSKRVLHLFHKPGMPRLIKACGIAATDDLAEVAAYSGAADLVLLDAKPPKDAAYPGGHGRPFDWAILRGLRDSTSAFLLSGGLDPHNLAKAIRIVRSYGVRLAGVDVSSGVESAPGVKDVAKIRDFVAAAREADARFPDLATPMKPMR